MISGVNFLKNEYNYFTPTRMAIIRKIENKCWQRHTEIGTLAGGSVEQCSPADSRVREDGRRPIYDYRTPAQ